MGTASPSGDSRCLERGCLPSLSLCHTGTCLWGLVGQGARLPGPQHPLAPEPTEFCFSASPSHRNPTGALFLLPHSLQETYEAKRKEFLGELQRKEEEMRQMFVNKVKETELELKEKEREVSAGWAAGPGQGLAGRREGLVPSRPTQKPGLPPSALSSTRSLSTSSGSTRRRSARWRRSAGSWRRRPTPSTAGRPRWRPCSPRPCTPPCSSP